MKSTWRVTRAVFVFGIATTIGTSAAVAQTSASDEGRALGGYGGSMTEIGTGMGGPTIPYAGRFGGFMPYRMGGGSLSFQSRGNSPMGSGRTSFSLSPISGGMSSMSGTRGRLPVVLVVRHAGLDGNGRRFGDGRRHEPDTRHGRDAAELRLPVPSAAEPPLALVCRHGHVDVASPDGHAVSVLPAPARLGAGRGGGRLEGTGGGRRRWGRGRDRVLVDLGADGPLQGRDRLAQLRLDLSDLEPDLEHLA